MQSIINRIENNQFWKFHGGIHPPEQKFLTNDKPIKPLHLPEMLIIPVQQHIGVPGDILVNVGDQVLKGEALTNSTSPMAVPIHAPTSGSIEKIALHTTAHPSGLSELCIFLKPDHNETWRKRNVCPDFKSLERSEIIHKIAEAGISGMGGAGFPTHIKVDSKPNIDFLIINAAECEPYITADDLLMQEHTATIIDGINILKHLLIPRIVLIGIEDNKPEAIAALKKATDDCKDIYVCTVPTKYPTGGEKQLIKTLTGKEITSGGLPIQQGIVMQNVATCYAIADAVINDTPLIKRVVTVSGQGLEKPQNMWAALGTPVKDLISHCVSAQTKTQQAVIMGGPMMGFTLPTDTVPVVKTTNCILVPSAKELNLSQDEVECIRCGQCAEACPAQLLPQEMQWSAKAKDHDKLKALNLFDCIDCGACAYVCPSHIPLVQYYRIAKAEIRQQELQDLKAEKAKARFEARKARLEREKKAREEKQRKASEARKAAMNSKSEEGTSAKSAVAAALARVKAKKAQSAPEESTPSTPNTPDSGQKSQVAAAIARAKAKKEKAKQMQQTEASQTATAPAEVNVATNTETGAEAKSSKVSAAIAKAKAKKAAKEQAAQNDVSEPADNKTSDTTDDKTSTDKKSRVANAVAKAKAKKLAAQQKENGASTASEEKNIIASNNEIADTETQGNQPIQTETKSTEQAESDKKERIAAAIKKAKAKKAGSASNAQVESPQSETSDDSDIARQKKARIAAAVAKAKAKKQQKEST